MIREGDHCAVKDPLRSGDAGPEPMVPEGPYPDGNEYREEEAGDASGADVAGSSDAGIEAGAGVEMDATSSLDGPVSADASVLMDASPKSEPDVGPVTPKDASTEGDGPDALLSDVTVPRDATQDANDGAGPNEAAVDGGDSGGSGLASCTETDLAQWRGFQTSTQLMPAIADCYARDPACAVGACELGGCLRGVAGVTSCSSCATEEARCALVACAAECGSSDTNDACRACSCRQGCIGTTSACAMGSVNACADCNGTTCSNMSLAPAIITVINAIYL
jgi:hypothetical protein